MDLSLFKYNVAICPHRVLVYALATFQLNSVIAMVNREVRVRLLLPFSRILFGFNIPREWSWIFTRCKFVVTQVQNMKQITMTSKPPFSKYFELWLQIAKTLSSFNFFCRAVKKSQNFVSSRSTKLIYDALCPKGVRNPKTIFNARWNFM